MEKCEEKAGYCSKKEKGWCLSVYVHTPQRVLGELDPLLAEIWAPSSRPGLRVLGWGQENDPLKDSALSSSPLPH